VVLIGPSGCGKTTTLRMINRLIEPTSGRIEIQGEDVTDLPATDLRRGIGYVIQQVGLFPHRTIEANIATVPRTLGWDRSRIRARVEELVEVVGIDREMLARYPDELSGGQQQRVGIARALAGDPDYMLMDEPFGAIDAITRSALQGEILRLQQQLQKTILFVSHDVDEALRLGDRIIVMNAGRIVQFDTPFNLLTQPASPFVHELLGADDMVRQLGLLPVNAAMMQLPDHYQNGNKPVVNAVDNLRDALSLILKTGAPELSVVKDGEPVGLLTLEHIRNCAVEANR